MVVSKLSLLPTSLIRFTHLLPVLLLFAVLTLPLRVVSC